MLLNITNVTIYIYHYVFHYYIYRERETTGMSHTPLLKVTLETMMKDQKATPWRPPAMTR